MTKRIIKVLSIILAVVAVMIITIWLEDQQEFVKEQTNNQNNQSNGSRSEPSIEFSTPPGFYQEEVTVTIDGGVEKGKIFYTLDGSQPTDQSRVYTEPIHFEKNTTLRAAVKLEEEWSNEVSASYLIEPPISLPVFSLIIEPDDLWSEEKGIYILGQNASSKYPFKGANYWEDWEVPVELEYFEDGKLSYKESAGLKIFGGETRTLPQKSLALYAKKEYGSKLFEYPFFPEKDIQEFNTFVLRNGGQDFAKTHIRDGLVSTLIQNTTIDHQAYRPVVVYLNGAYWGIHDFREKVDDDFLVANHPGVKKKEIDLLEADAIEKEGTNDEYLQLVQFIKQHDLAKEENYQEVLKQLDIENFMDYLIAQLYIANTDWPSHNIRFWKENNGSPKWRWILYDSDLSLENYKENTVARLMEYKGKGEDSLYISFLFRELMKNSQFRTELANKMDDHLENTFHPETVVRTIRQLKEEIESEIPKHLEKWGGEQAHWEEEIKRLEEFARKRPLYLKEHFQELVETYN
jgi:hypothetical protein